MLQQSFDRQELAIQRLNGLSNMSLVQFLIAAVLTDQKANSVLLGTSNPAYLLHNMESVRYTDNLAEHLPLISMIITKNTFQPGQTLGADICIIGSVQQLFQWHSA